MKNSLTNQGLHGNYLIINSLLFWFKIYTILKNRYKSASYGFVAQLITKLSTVFVEKFILIRGGGRWALLSAILTSFGPWYWGWGNGNKACSGKRQHFQYHCYPT